MKEQKENLKLKFLLGGKWKSSIIYQYIQNIVNFALTWEKGPKYKVFKEPTVLLISAVNCKQNRVNEGYLKNYPFTQRRDFFAN